VEAIDNIIHKIAMNIKNNCVLVTPVAWQHVPLEEFVKGMLSCVWMSIAPHKSQLR
jgi:hypothetical protein